MAIAASNALTVEDLEALPDDGRRHELIGGAIGDRVQPDLVIVPVESVGEKRLAGRALLIVEVVSPGSKVHDRVTKRAVYEAAGVPAYWIVEPAAGHFLALRRGEGGGYESYADTEGPVEIDWPVAATFTVADLAAR